MNCREFREIADTYLSDELLVETNHDVHQHLEHCIDCRNELASRRVVRSKLRSAVMNDESASIDPIFANKLRISLREQSKGKAYFSFRNLGLAFASVAVLLLSTISIINYMKSDNDLASWRKLSEEAIVTHKECAIGHRNDWIESEKVSTPEKIKFQNSVLDPLKVKYGEDFQVIDMHECEFYGKTYRHYVLRSNEHTISLIQNETDSAVGTKTFLEADKIISEPRGGYQLASFAANGNANPVFIISDLTEAENLTLARSVRNSPSI